MVIIRKEVDDATTDDEHAHEGDVKIEMSDPSLLNN
jgi:hypothetical protein